MLCQVISLFKIVNVSYASFTSSMISSTILFHNLIEWASVIETTLKIENKK